MNPFSLEGKNILITGASSGIGAATAIECSRSGANVIISGRNEERLKLTSDSLYGGNHEMAIGDILNEDFVNELICSLPPLDGVFLSAGINQTLPIGFMSPKKIGTIFNVNFFGQVELFRILFKKKKLKEGASVVSVSSIGGTEVYTPGASAYGASKAALQSFVKTAAKELAPKIRLNCIAPGQINTPMNTQGGITDEQYETYKNSIPMKRFGEPEEIAYAAIYLLSDASKWITGTTITIDGGTSL